MPGNISKVFTPNGSRLVSKFSFPLAYYKNLKGNFSKEVVTIETSFGKEHTIITSFFNSHNMLAKRIIERTKSKRDTEKRVFTYKGHWENRRKTIIDKFVNNRKIETIVKSEVLLKSDNKPFLTRVVLTLVPKSDKSRSETQVIEELSTNKYRKYIRTTAQRDKSGTLLNKVTESNVGNLKQLSESPYLHFRNYSLKDFLISIIPYAKNKQKVQNRDIKYVFASLSKDVAANSMSSDRKGTLTFDLDKLICQSRIVDTVNHEFRHQYQNQMIENFSEIGIKSFFKKVFNPVKYFYAKKCSKGFENYVPSSVDRTKYEGNFVEIDARKAASKAKQEFLDESAMLDHLFPYSKELFTGNDSFFEEIEREIYKTQTD